MKIRNGFVSNSSSSSFILYGANVTLNESMDENEYEKCQAQFTIIDDDKWFLIGSTIMSDVENYNIKKIDLSDAEKSDLNNKITSFLNDNNIGFSNIEFGMFAGSDYN